jgi:hypothetical protein
LTAAGPIGPAAYTGGSPLMDVKTPQDEPRSYEKPAVETEEVFETLALACTKADTQCVPPPGGSTLQS